MQTLYVLFVMCCVILAGKVPAVESVRGGETREAAGTHGAVRVRQDDSAQCAGRAARGVAFLAPLKLTLRINNPSDQNIRVSDLQNSHTMAVLKY